MNPPAEEKPRSPGDYIRDELKARGWTQDDLARVLGRPLPTVNEIIKGKRAIMPEMAIALGEAFGTPAEVWVHREGLYSLSKVETAGQGDVKRRARMHELAPVKEMQKRGWIGPTSTASELEAEITRFYGIPSLDIEPDLAVAMRKTRPNAELTPAQKAWVFRVRELASAHRVAAFNHGSLDDCAKELRKLASYSAGAGKAPAVLAKHGIRFVIVEPLSGGKADGVALWLDADSPVIGMSLRFDRLDSFWFTLGHELSHIRHHDAVTLDGDVVGHEDLLEVKSPVERRADEESAATFIDPSELQSFIKRVGPLYSKERINQFANRIKVHPGLIVGQLKHRAEMGYSANSEMHVKVRHFVTPSAIADGWGHTIDPRALS